MLHHSVWKLLVCYGGHLESKMDAKMALIPQFGENLSYQNRFCWGELISVIIALQLGAINDLQNISFLATSPRLLSGDVLLFYVSFSLLFFLLLLFFHTFLSARFLGDALIKLYETL